MEKSGAPKRERSQKLAALAECGVMVAAAFVLSFIKVYRAPLGGSVTLASAAPIIFVSYRRGVKWGLASGFVYAVLQLVVGLGDVSYIPEASGIAACVLLDYIIPFTLLGLGGMFAKLRLVKGDGVNLTLTAALGAASVMLIRFVSSTLCGAVVWYSVTRRLGWYADDPAHLINNAGMWTYSTVYNASYLIPELIITTAVAALLIRALAKAKLGRAPTV